MLLEIKQARGGYGRGDVIKGVSCQADKGEILCLLGPNGCGKTTLFRMILGSLPVTDGSILIDGHPVNTLTPKESARLVAYIPQHHTPVYPYTALEVVMMGRASYLSSFETPKAKDRQAAYDALETVGIAHFADRPYTTLSGGQRQLVLIARAICQSAKLFVMDEPDASLDYANHSRFTDLVSGLAKQGYGIVLSTHSPEHPIAIGHKVLLLNDGTAAAFGTPQEVITPKNLEDVYRIEMDVASFQDRYGVTHTVCIPVKRPEELP